VSVRGVGRLPPMTAILAPALSDAELADLRDAVAGFEAAFLADLEHLVNIDCGSYTKAGVDTVGGWLGDRLRSLGASVEVRPHDVFGDTVIGTFQGTADGPVVLCLAHMDTVFPEGTVAQRPFRIDDGIARGPGVTDMKAGLLAGLYAMAALRALPEGLPVGRLIFVGNPDEEVGSPISTRHIVELAADADVSLVLECARANGDIVSSRKGMLSFRVDVHGRAAHAGVEPEKGRSAILEAARIVTELHALNGRRPGVTVNVGVIAGGTRPNVVAESCRLEVDARAVRRADLEAVEAEIRAVIANGVVPGIRTDVAIEHRWWPMEKLESSARLVDHAVALAGALGFTLRDAATGGASDGNTTAGLGVPTIDGLGPIGGLDHSPEEYLEVASIVPRTALLAALIVAIGRDPAFRSGPPTTA